MTDFVEMLGKLIALIVGIFTVAKVVSYPLVRRIQILEDAPEKREVEECKRLMASCPIYIHVTGLKDQLTALKEQTRRVEDKLDRLIERP
jgi:hypothetical protein